MPGHAHFKKESQFLPFFDACCYAKNKLIHHSMIQVMLIKQSCNLIIWEHFMKKQQWVMASNKCWFVTTRSKNNDNVLNMAKTKLWSQFEPYLLLFRQDRIIPENLILVVFKICKNLKKVMSQLKDWL